MPAAVTEFVGDGNRLVRRHSKPAVATLNGSLQWRGEVPEVSSSPRVAGLRRGRCGARIGKRCEYSSDLATQQIHGVGKKAGERVAQA